MKSVMQLTDEILGESPEFKQISEEELPELTDEQREIMLESSKGKERLKTGKAKLQTGEKPSAGEASRLRKHFNKKPGALSNAANSAGADKIGSDVYDDKPGSEGTRRRENASRVEPGKQFVSLDDALQAPYLGVDEKRDGTYGDDPKPTGNAVKDRIKAASKETRDSNNAANARYPDPGHKKDKATKRAGRGKKKGEEGHVDSRSKQLGGRLANAQTWRKEAQNKVKVAKRLGADVKKDSFTGTSGLTSQAADIRAAKSGLAKARKSRENAWNELSNHELSVLKEAASIMKKLNESRSENDYIDSAPDITLTPKDAKTGKPAYKAADLNKKDPKATKLYKKTKAAQAGESTDENCGAAPTTVGTVGAGPLKALGKGKVSLLKKAKGKKAKKANESFNRFLDNIINEVKSN